MLRDFQVHKACDTSLTTQQAPLTWHSEPPIPPLPLPQTVKSENLVTPATPETETLSH